MDNSSIPLATNQLYWSRTSPEYTRLFNMAAFALINRRQPALAIVSSSLYAVEIIKRAPYSIALAGTGTLDAHIFTDLMTSWAWGEIHSVNLQTEQGKFTTILWAQPLKESAEAVSARLKLLAERGCDLEIICASRIRWSLSKFLIPRKSSSVKLKDIPLSPADTMKLLKLHGWQVDTIIPFNGPRASFWRLLADSFNRINWLSWSDRCLHMMRSQLREPVRLWPLASMVLIRARSV